MKKLLFPIAILAAVAIVFTSCNNDENDDPRPPESAVVQINATNVVAPSVVQVRAVAFDYEWNGYTVSSTSFGSNAFSMFLAETPHTNTLENFDSQLLSEFEVSNPSVKTAGLNDLFFGTIVVFIEGFSSNDGTFLDADHLGDFWNERFEVDTITETFSITTETYVYVTENVTISGNFYYEEVVDEVTSVNWDVQLVKGWNRAFFTFGVDEEGFFETLTTTPVTGLTWTFEIGNDPSGIAPMGVALKGSAKARMIERIGNMRTRGTDASTLERRRVR